MLLAALPALNALVCNNGAACICTQNPCDIFKCDTVQSCQATVLGCDSTRCHMDCTGVQSCQASHLQCISDTCQIRCTQSGSCQLMKKYDQAGVLTTHDLDSEGKSYGMWMAAKADEGKLICDGVHSCQNSQVGCASDSCETHCNGLQACQLSSFTATSSSEGALARCTNKESCKKAEFQYKFTNGDVKLQCDNEGSCMDATVRCPDNHNCVVECNGAGSCKAMKLECPHSLPAGKKCEIKCVGNNACEGIGETQATGKVCSTCDANAGCTTYLSSRTSCSSLPVCASNAWHLLVPVVGSDLNLCNNLCRSGLLQDVSKCVQFCGCSAVVPTAAPATLSPLPACDKWRLKVAGVTIPLLTCDAVCKTVDPVFNEATCRQYCVCDIETPAPATNAPATLTPLPPCDNWRFTVAGVTLPFVDCNDICKPIGGLLDADKEAKCRQYCSCETGAPATAVPPTNTPLPPCSQDSWSLQVPVLGSDLNLCNNFCRSGLLQSISSCVTFCKCTEATPAPATLSPLPACDKWRLKVAGVTIPLLTCDAVCKTVDPVFNEATCRQYCVCDIETSAPATNAPATLTPLPPCDNWRFTVAGVTLPFVDCNDICKPIGGLLDADKEAKCRQYCSCETGAPATAVPVTAVPQRACPSDTWGLQVPVLGSDSEICNNFCRPGTLQSLTTCNTFCKCLDGCTSGAGVPLWGKCLDAPHCCAEGTCYEQNQWYAQCAPSCSISAGWTCRVLGGAAPAPPTSGGCTSGAGQGMWGNCLAAPHCCAEGTCYEQNQWYAQCRPSCSSAGGLWSCRVLGGVAPTLAPLPACDEWRLKVAGVTIPFLSCNAVCKPIGGLFDADKEAQCRQYCRCQTEAPATAAPPTLAPLPACDEWRVKVAGVTIPFLSCNAVCKPIGGLFDAGKEAQCRQYCRCQTEAPATAAPMTLAPLPACDEWRLKLAGVTIPFLSCNAVCKPIGGLFDADKEAQCRQYCRCQTEAPATAAPPTSVPTTLAPIPACNQWGLKVAGITLNCASICSAVTGVIGNEALCRANCRCLDTDAPATLAPTATPSTNAPGVRVTLKKLFRLVLKVLLSLFDKAAFLRSLKKLLSKQCRNVKVHWTCPASACVGGCPKTTAAKLAAGCTSLYASPSRMADVLQSSGGDLVVDFEAGDYLEGATEDTLAATLEEERTTPSEFSTEYKLEAAVELVDSEVFEAEEQESSDDDSLAPGFIALIVCLGVLALIVIAVFIVCILKGKKSTPDANQPDKEQPQFDAAV